MKPNKSKSAALSLIELIISILIFSIAAAVCIQVYAAAHDYSSNGKYLRYAVTSLQTTAEYFKGSHGNIATTSNLLKELDNCTILESSDNTIKCQFDFPQSKNNANYSITVTVTASQTINYLRQAVLSAYQNNNQANNQNGKNDQSNPIFTIHVGAVSNQRSSLHE